MSSASWIGWGKTGEYGKSAVVRKALISWFKKTILTEEQISAMFDTVCCRLSDLPDKKVVHGYADFEFLKDHPYLRVDDKVYDIDYEYAVAKLESGALWRVAMSMPTDQRLNYFGFWAMYSRNM